MHSAYPKLLSLLCKVCSIKIKVLVNFSAHSSALFQLFEKMDCSLFFEKRTFDPIWILKALVKRGSWAS